MKKLGVMGGTFDPIHMGHLDVARASADALRLDEVRLLPSNVPPHRDPPKATGFHRFAMVCMSAQTDARFTAFDEELRRDGPSFAFDTLRSLQQQGFSRESLFFLTGADAFVEIARWRGYPGLLDLAHFVVCSRPGRSAGMVRGLLPELQDRMDDGRIILLDAATADVSSSQVRETLAAGGSIDHMVAPGVEAHIRKHGLYK